MIEIEYFTLTGMLGNTGETGLLYLKIIPSTGPNGLYDVAVDPTNGPSQAYGTDFGVTSSGLTGVVYFNMDSSDIQDVLLYPDVGSTGPLYLRVLYNGFTGI